MSVLSRTTPRTRSFEGRKSKVVSSIFRWYSNKGRTLPWRGETNSYRILVSEIMLQQTQVSRVLQIYPVFLKRFPDFGSLARARTSSVIRAWKGMGYNNRAIRLQQVARTLLRNHRGALPTDVETLQTLPGIGKYTAHALVCLVHHKHVPVVDTNISRVLSRIYPPEARKMDIWDLAAITLPRRSADRWNQALMDLGAMVCTSSAPKCGMCPVAKYCPSAFRVSPNKRTRNLHEPSRDGLPNRIYRGRIVSALRETRATQFISAHKLGHTVKPSYSLRDKKWLEQLVRGLEKDGLVVIRRTKLGLAVALPE